MPHAIALSNSRYGRFFYKKLNLPLFQSQPKEWREVQLKVVHHFYGPKTEAGKAVTQQQQQQQQKQQLQPIISDQAPTIPIASDTLSNEPTAAVAEATSETKPKKEKKRKSREPETDEMDELFADVVTDDKKKKKKRKGKQD